MEAQAAQGQERPTVRINLPRNVREHSKPDSDDISNALPGELVTGFRNIEVWMESVRSIAVIQIDISEEKAKALKRMKAEGRKSTAGLKVNKKAKTEAKAAVKTEVKTEVKEECERS